MDKLTTLILSEVYTSNLIRSKKLAEVIASNSGVSIQAGYARINNLIEQGLLSKWKISRKKVYYFLTQKATDEVSDLANYLQLTLKKYVLALPETEKYQIMGKWLLVEPLLEKLSEKQRNEIKNNDKAMKVLNRYAGEELQTIADYLVNYAFFCNEFNSALDSTS